MLLCAWNNRSQSLLFLPLQYCFQWKGKGGSEFDIFIPYVQAHIKEGFLLKIVSLILVSQISCCLSVCGDKGPLTYHLPTRLDKGT